MILEKFSVQLESTSGTVLPLSMYKSLVPSTTIQKGRVKMLSLWNMLAKAIPILPTFQLPGTLFNNLPSRQGSNKQQAVSK